MSSDLNANSKYRHGPINPPRSPVCGVISGMCALTSFGIVLRDVDQVPVYEVENCISCGATLGSIVFRVCVNTMHIVDHFA